MSVSPTTIDSMLQVSFQLYNQDIFRKSSGKLSNAPPSPRVLARSIHSQPTSAATQLVESRSTSNFQNSLSTHLNTPLLEKCEANTDHPSCNSLHMIFPGGTSFTSDTSETRSLEHRLGRNQTPTCEPGNNSKPKDAKFSKQRKKRKINSNQFPIRNLYQGL